MPSVLLDTNVISEMVRAEPDGRVVAFLEALSPTALFTSTICLAEIRDGLESMPAGQKQDRLRLGLSRFMEEAFSDRILPFDRVCAEIYGRIRAERSGQGHPISVQDAMIAATAQAHGLTLATRNIKDFANCRLPLVNPWDGP